MSEHSSSASPPKTTHQASNAIEHAFEMVVFAS